MNIFEAANELTKRAEKYQFDHPHISYEDATKIILDEDPVLAAAYDGTDSPRTANIKRQFELDKKLKENPDNLARDITEYQYKTTMIEAMGWREASKIYGVDVEREIIEKLQREIMDLQNKQILYQKTISNFPDKSKRQKEIIEELQGHLGSDIGHIPSIEEIKREQDKLINIQREAAIAEEELPNIEAELSKLRKKLEKIEANKKHSRQKLYTTPSEELTKRAKRYSRQYGMQYETAVNRILKDDLVLSTAYNYDVDKLLGLKG